MAQDDHADFNKHTDEELREGIQRAEEQDQRIASEESERALEAERRQRAAMEHELKERES